MNLNCIDPVISNRTVMDFSEYIIPNFLSVIKPNIKVVIDLGYVKKNSTEKKLSFCLNIRTKKIKEMNGIDYSDFYIIIPTKKRNYEYKFKIYVPSLINNENVFNSVFTTEMPDDNYFFVEFRGKDLSPFSVIDGEMCLFPN